MTPFLSMMNIVGIARTPYAAVDSAVSDATVYRIPSAWAVLVATAASSLVTPSTVSPWAE